MVAKGRLLGCAEKSWHVWPWAMPWAVLSHSLWSSIPFGPCAKMLFHLGSACSSCAVSCEIAPRNEGLRDSLVKQREPTISIEEIWTAHSPRHCIKHLRSKVCCRDLEVKPKPRKSNRNAQKFFLGLRALWNGNLLPQTLVFDACWSTSQFLTETAFYMNTTKSMFVTRNLTKRNDYERWKKQIKTTILRSTNLACWSPVERSNELSLLL